MSVTYPSDGVALAIVEHGRFGNPELAQQLLADVDAAIAFGCSVVVIASDEPGYFIAHWSLQVGSPGTELEFAL